MNDSPVCVAGEVDLAAGETRPVSMEALDSAKRDWTEFSELRVLIQPLVQQADGAALSGALQYVESVLGGIIEVKLKSGRHYLTEDFVPAFMLSPTVLRAFEESLQVIFADNANSIQLLPAVHITWGFDRPLICRPGTVLDAEARRPSDTLFADTSLIMPNDIRVTVSMAGKKLAEPPRTSVRCVPYVTAFRPQTPQYPQNQAFANINVGDLALQNPFIRPLYVKRINFRAMANPSNPDPGSAPPRQFDVDSFASDTNRLKLQIWDGLNREVYVKTNQVTQDNLNTPVPFADALMAPQLRSIRVDDVLQPREYYRATMGRYMDQAPTDGVSVVPMISMVGYREEAL